MIDLIEQVRLGYARGWSFTPLHGKRPFLTAWQTAPRESLAQALAWASKGNVGLRTGMISGVAVIDIEAESPMDRTDFPKTVTAFTGGGGYHLYYRCSKPVPNSVGKPDKNGRLPKNAIGEGVDVRGDGGQVVFVGSVHPETGQQYRWFAFHAPGQVPAAEFPYHLLPEPEPERVRPPEPVFIDPSQAEQRCLKYVQTCNPAISGSGGHNATFRVACKCFQFGLDESAAWRVMQWYNANKCDPPWSEREIGHKINSARKSVTERNEFGIYLVEDAPQEQAASAPGTGVLSIDEIEAY